MPPTVQRIAGFGAARENAERELSANQVPLPLPQRQAWQQAVGLADTLLLIARDAEGTPLAAQSAGISISRALPGHRIYRVERFNAGASPEMAAALVQAVAASARGDALCLRVVVETFERDIGVREQLYRVLHRVQFKRSPTQRMYRKTLAVDLHRSEEEIFAGLQSKARRDVKAPAKRGLELHPITEQVFANELRVLSNEAFRRTNGSDESRPWERIIELSARHPELSRVVGLFDPRTPGAAGLVAFAWGCCHGSYASYEAGGSVRRADLGSTPVGYAPVWDLIKWARANTTAAWFDLGGVSEREPGDTRAGIAEFKRYFSDDLVEVSDEWRMEPHPVRAAIARLVSSAVAWAQRTSGKLRESEVAAAEA